MNTRSTASCYLERAIYVVVFIGLILCLVGCGRQSVYSEGIRASTAAAGATFPHRRNKCALTYGNRKRN